MKANNALVLSGAPSHGSPAGQPSRFTAEATVPGRPDLSRVKGRALGQLKFAEKRYASAIANQTHYLLLRWIASMTVVEIYAIWERYAEKRLTVALAHHPEQLIEDNDIRGMKFIPVGLASILVRGGGRYFDFRSCSDLIDRSKRLVGAKNSPFRVLTKKHKQYLDTLGAIRNVVVHQSDSALAAYRRHLTEVYGLKAKPGPDEFLNAIDYRAGSPARYQQRVNGLIVVVGEVVNAT
jgi:hypothetical protein